MSPAIRAMTPGCCRFRPRLSSAPMDKSRLASSIRTIASVCQSRICSTLSEARVSLVRTRTCCGSPQGHQSKETLVASEGLKAWRYPIRNNSYPVARETDLKENSMILHRREWLLGAAGGLALSLTVRRRWRSAPHRKASGRSPLMLFRSSIRAPSSLSQRSFFRARGSVLSETWRIRQFEYVWLRTIAERYADFWQVTEDALIYAAKSLRAQPQHRC